MRVVKLSVIMPFFNVQTYAPDALRSLRANAREDFEFILVDDCSTDGTREILERAARDLPGAVHIRREESGVSAARNTGLDVARGEYITFLDGDDWVSPAISRSWSRTSRISAAISCVRTMSGARAPSAPCTGCRTARATAWSIRVR